MERNGPRRLRRRTGVLWMGLDRSLEFQPMIIAPLSASLLLAEPPPAASPPPAAPAPAAAAVKKVEVKFACHREASLGARLPTRPCRSKAEIADQQRED